MSKVAPSIGVWVDKCQLPLSGTQVTYFMIVRGIYFTYLDIERGKLFQDGLNGARVSWKPKTC